MAARVALVVVALVACSCASENARLGAPTAVPVVATAAVSSPTPTVSAGPRRVLLADLEGTVGPRGLLPAGGEITCRGRAVLTIDMTRQPPFGRVRVDFEIDMTACPEGTVVTEIHVHDNVPGHSDRIYMGAAVEHAQALIGGAGLVVATNSGIDPRVADEVLGEPARFILAIHTERNFVGGAGRGVLRAR